MLAQKLTLSGIALGNAEVDPIAAFESYGDWLFNLGFVAEPQRDELTALGAKCAAQAARNDLRNASKTCCEGVASHRPRHRPRRPVTSHARVFGLIALTTTLH